MIETILNYVWFVLKLLALFIIISIPILISVYIFQGYFQRSKKSFLWKLSIVTYFISLIGINLLYFIPVFKVNLGYNFGGYLAFIGLHLLWLILINLLLTGIFIIFGFICKGIYDYLSKDKNKIKKIKEAIQINLKFLWISLIITWVIIFIVYVLFPKLIAMLLFLIYLI